MFLPYKNIWLGSIQCVFHNEINILAGILLLKVGIDVLREVLWQFLETVVTKNLVEHLIGFQEICGLVCDLEIILIGPLEGVFDGWVIDLTVDNDWWAAGLGWDLELKELSTIIVNWRQIFDLHANFNCGDDPTSSLICQGNGSIKASNRVLRCTCNDIRF